MAVFEWALNIWILWSICAVRTCLTCDVDAVNISEFATLSTVFQKALKDEANLFQMRRAFFHSPTADPVLLKVVYIVTYADNIRKAFQEDKLQSCDSLNTKEKGDTHRTKTQNEPETQNLIFQESNYTFGWTSTGVYVVFHPMVLNLMQAQAPFMALRLVHFMLDQKSAEANTFLWDGSNDLPPLNLSLHIQNVTDLPCIPSKDLLKCVLMDINTLLHVHAAQAEELHFGSTTEFIGFTINESSVTASEISYSSDVYMVILYSAFFLFTYWLTWLTFYVWYNSNQNNDHRMQQIKTVHKLMEKYKNLMFGTIINAAIASITDTVAKLVNFYRIHHKISILSVWLPQLLLLILGTIVVIVCIYHIIDCYKTGNGFSYGYVLIPLHFFSCALFFMLFPAIILVLAYPTQMLATMIFVVAYLFATTTLATILMQLFKPSVFKLQISEQNCHTSDGIQYSVKQYAVVIISYTILLVLALFIGLLPLYSLLIGKGSAINTGPQFVISMLPSALVSAVALIAQVYVNNKHQERPITNRHGQPPSRGHPSDGQPSSDQPSSDQPSSGQSCASQPPSGQPVAHYSLRRRRQPNS